MKFKILFISALLSLLMLTITVGNEAKAEGELFLYNKSDYIPPKLLERFEKETNISVTLEVYDSDETLLDELKSGESGYDVVVASGSHLKTLIVSNLLEIANVRLLKNYKNILPPHNTPFFDKRLEYVAPYMWGTTGLTYDSELVNGGSLPDSWSVFFNPPESLKGEIAALDEAEELYYAAAYYLGINKCTENLQDSQKIQILLLTQKPNLSLYSSEETVERMVAGEVILHHQLNGDSYLAHQKKDSLRYIYPKEGISLWGDYFAIVKGAKNRVNAKIFINWMLEPNNAAEASNFTGYMNAVKGSKALLDATLKSDPAVNMPAEFRSRLRPALDCSKKAIELRDSVWKRVFE